MQPRFQNYPEFMVECSLFDIIPPDTVSLDLSVRLGEIWLFVILLY